MYVSEVESTALVLMVNNPYAKLHVKWLSNKVPVASTSKCAFGDVFMSLHGHFIVRLKIEKWE